MIKLISTFAIITIALLTASLSQANGNDLSQANGVPAQENGPPRVNNAPMAKGTIDTVTIGNDSVIVDISDKFSDPDSSDTLRFRPTISETTIVTARVDSSNVDSPKVIISPNKVFNTTITVTAIDSCDSTATQTIAVKVSRPPVAAGTIAPVRIGTDSVVVDISNKFRDLDGDRLTYEVDDTTTILTAYVDSSNVDSPKVIIKPVAGGGITVIAVTATDPTGLTAKQHITVVPDENIKIIIFESIIFVSLLTGIGGLFFKFVFNFKFNMDSLISQKGKIEENKYELKRNCFIIGIIGLGLPLVLIIDAGLCTLYGDATMSNYTSIWAYRDSKMWAVFIGTLCVIGTFLVAYKGYDARDNQASNIAGLLAILFPLHPVLDIETVGKIMPDVLLTALFLVLAYISRYRFTKSKSESILSGTPKAKRNQVYKWCAYMMIFGLLAIGAFKLLELSLNDNKRCIGW